MCIRDRSGGDTNIIGSAVSSDGDATIDVGGDLTVETLQDTVDQTDVAGGFSGGGSGGGDSSGSGEASLNFELGLQDQAQSNTVAGISVANNLDLTTGGDTTLTGSTIEGGTVNAEIGGDLTITSLQDTADNIDVNLSLEANGAGGEDGENGSGGFGIEAGVGVEDSQVVTTVAGIAATSGDLNANVGGTTTLTGGLIASTAEGGQTNLSTENLVVADIQDEVLEVDAGLNLSAGGLGGGADESDQNFAVGGNLGVTQGDGSTISTIGEGSLVIRSGEEVEVNRDITQVQNFNNNVDFEVGGNLEVSNNGVEAEGNIRVDDTEVGGSIALSEDSVSASGNVNAGDVQVGGSFAVSENSVEASGNVNVDGTEVGGSIAVSESSVSASGSATIDGTTVEGGLSVSEDGAAEANFSVSEEEAGAETTEVAAIDDEENLTPAQRALRRAQAAVNNAGQAQDQGPRATTEQMNQILDQFRVGADVTPIQAQAASDNVFNGGNPVESPVLTGLSPAQQVIVLQQARIWLNSEEQVVLDRAIQQISTGESNTLSQDDDS